MTTAHRRGHGAPTRTRVRDVFCPRDLDAKDILDAEAARAPRQLSLRPTLSRRHPSRARARAEDAHATRCRQTSGLSRIAPRPFSDILRR